MSRKNYNNYSKMSTNKVEGEPIENTEVEAVPEEVVVTKTITGIVTDCTKLNVRKAPKADAYILCEIAAGTKLTIDKKSSTKEWYKVCTEAGIEGYCMKKYITV